MARRRERDDSDAGRQKPGDDTDSSSPHNKKQRTRQEGIIDDGQQQPSHASLQERPKSKKELRAEKKRARRLAVDPEHVAMEEKRLMEAKRKENEREELKQLIKEERKEKKIRQQKRKNRERNAPGASSEKKPPSESSPPSDKPKGATETTDEDEIARKIMHEIRYGRSDTSGWTVLRLGVKYKDIAVGKGPMVQNKSLVTVKYQLSAGKLVGLIDSSKKFSFRVAKGEVIQGWDIGVFGMREGGRRQLVVPPKAGYGSQDIGGGPGALLHFDITVLSVR